MAFLEIFICMGLLVYWLSRLPILLRHDEDEMDSMMELDCWMVRWFVGLWRSLFQGPHIV
jgi:hypothetical protein